jgi:hypothetical protein
MRLRWECPITVHPQQARRVRSGWQGPQDSTGAGTEKQLANGKIAGSLWQERMPRAKDKAKIAKERKEKWEREVLSRQVSRAQAILELEGHIRASPEADTALKTLVQAGCNEQTILWSLYQFCGGSPTEARDVKRAFETRRQYLLRVSRRLMRLATDLQTARSYLSDMELEIVVPQNLIEQIPSLAAFLNELANTVVKRYAWKRTSGRDHHLVFLAMMIEQATGREHYKELADLVHTIRLAYDPTYDETETAETLRNLVDRNRPLDLASSPETTQRSENGNSE